MCRGCVGDVQGMCRGCAGGVQVYRSSLLGSVTQYTRSKHGAHDIYRMTGRRVGSRLGGGWGLDRRRVTCLWFVSIT